MSQLRRQEVDRLAFHSQWEQPAAQDSQVPFFFLYHFEVTWRYMSQNLRVRYLLDKPIHLCVCGLPKETRKTTLLAIKLSCCQHVMSVTLSKGNELRLSDWLLHVRQNTHVWIMNGFSQSCIRNVDINRKTMFWQKSTWEPVYLGINLYILLF